VPVGLMGVEGQGIITNKNLIRFYDKEWQWCCVKHGHVCLLACKLTGRNARSTPYAKAGQKAGKWCLVVTGLCGGGRAS